MSDDYLFEKARREVSSQMRKQEKLLPLDDPRGLLEISEERLAEKELEKIAPSTGYPDLDPILRGFIPGRLYTLTGNENVGKTSLACNFAVRIARQNKKVLYFALEPENTVIDYLASVREDKMFHELTTYDLMYDEGMIHVYGKAQISTIPDLIRAVKEAKIHYDLIIIDHIGYFIKSQNNHIQEQSNVLKELAGLAKANMTAIMLIAHLRKKQAGQKKDYVPTNDDIAGSGAFKQDSTEVMIVVRQFDPEDPDKIRYAKEGKLFVTKTKSGPNGSIDLLFSERKANIISVGELMANGYANQLKEEREAKEKEQEKKLVEQTEVFDGIV